MLLTGRVSGAIVLEATSPHALSAIRNLYPMDIEETLHATSEERSLAFYQYPYDLCIRQKGILSLLPGLRMHSDGSRVLLPSGLGTWPNLEAPMRAIPDWLRECAFTPNESALSISMRPSTPCNMRDNTLEDPVSNPSGTMLECTTTNSTIQDLQRNGSVVEYARHLAVYLDEAGVQPCNIGWNWNELFLNLMHQYSMLSKKQRRQARLSGHIRIHRAGLLAESKALLADLDFRTDPPPDAEGAVINGRKCPHCRTKGFKTIWESQAIAEAFCAGSCDALLEAYPCPHGYGWHVGHIHSPKRKGKKQKGS